MKPLISVIVPVRERVDMLGAMLRSLWAKVEDGDSVEVVMRCDYDDDAMIEYLRTRQELFAVGPRRNGYATLGSLINDAARLSQADLIIVVNDDVEFVTHGWDVKLRAAAAQFPDGLFNLGVDTVMNNANCVFPCISRRLMQVLGCFYDERLVYPDIWLRDVMEYFGRMVRVPEVTIRHNWLGESEDQVRAGRQVHGNASYAALYDLCVAEGREKVRMALEMEKVVA